MYVHTHICIYIYTHTQTKKYVNKRARAHASLNSRQSTKQEVVGPGKELVTIAVRAIW